MPKFVTVGYGGQQGYSRTIKTVRDAAHVQDTALRTEGAVMSVAEKPVQVRNPDAAGVETVDGAYMSSALPVASFAIIEAVDLADAIKKVSTVPCAVAYRVVEVWPLIEVR